MPKCRHVRPTSVPPDLAATPTPPASRPRAATVPATWVPCPYPSLGLSSARGSRHRAPRKSPPQASSAYPLPSSSIPFPAVSPRFVQRLPARSGCVGSMPVSTMATVTPSPAVTSHAAGAAIRWRPLGPAASTAPGRTILSSPACSTWGSRARARSSAARSRRDDPSGTRTNVRERSEGRNSPRQRRARTGNRRRTVSAKASSDRPRRRRSAIPGPVHRHERRRAVPLEPRREPGCRRVTRDGAARRVERGLGLAGERRREPDDRAGTRGRLLRQGHLGSAQGKGRDPRGPGEKKGAPSHGGWESLRTPSGGVKRRTVLLEQLAQESRKVHFRLSDHLFHPVCSCFQSVAHREHARWPLACLRPVASPPLPGPNVAEPPPIWWTP